MILPWQIAQGLVLGCLWLAILVDIPCLISLGPLSGLALLTVMESLLPLLLWAVSLRFYRDAWKKCWPLILLLFVGWLALIWHSPTTAFFQNLLILQVFIVLMLVSYGCSRTSQRFSRQTIRWLAGGSTIALLGYGFTLLQNGLGASSLIGPRSFALFALIALSCQLAAWRYQGTAWLLLAGLTVTLVGASLSRLALVVGVLLIPLARISHEPRKWTRNALSLALLGAVLWGSVMTIEPLRTRFMDGDTSLQVGGVAVNASGRTAMWGMVWESFLESPVIGKGAGSADELMVTRIQDVAVGHPHCDYLRILHDYGAVGLSLWIMGTLLLFRTCWQAWRKAESLGDPQAEVHLAALLGLFSLAMGMTTDNPMIYLFVMAPVAILTGCSLGSAAYRTIEEDPHARIATP